MQSIKMLWKTWEETENKAITLFLSILTFAFIIIIAILSKTLSDIKNNFNPHIFNSTDLIVLAEQLNKRLCSPI